MAVEVATEVGREAATATARVVAEVALEAGTEAERATRRPGGVSSRWSDTKFHSAAMNALLIKDPGRVGGHHGGTQPALLAECRR